MDSSFSCGGFLTRSWIEKAVLCEEEQYLPKKVKARIYEIEDENEYGEYFTVISDGELFIKALFTRESVLTFLNDRAEDLECFTQIIGGFIVIPKYKIIPKVEEDLDDMEFVIVIKHFKLYGGEGTDPKSCKESQSEIINSKDSEPISNKLSQVWEMQQLQELCKRYLPSNLRRMGKWTKVDDLLDKIAESHTNICLFTGTFVSGLDVLNEGILSSSGTSSLNQSEKTSSSSFSQPVHPNLLMDFADCAPLVLDFNETSSSQSDFMLTPDCIRPNSPSMAQQSAPGDLTLLMGLADDVLDEKGQSQLVVNQELIPRPQLSLDTTSSSYSENSSKDIANFIDEYWIRKYREVTLQ